MATKKPVKKATTKKATVKKATVKKPTKKATVKSTAKTKVKVAAVKAPSKKELAKQAEQEKLIQTLKFTPRKYKIEVSGYGGEIAMGTVSKETFMYFRENNIDMGEYAWDSDNNFEVPDEHNFIQYGSWYDCDSIAHESGAEVCSSTYINVYDENGDEVWSCTLYPEDLEKAGVGCEETWSVYSTDQPEGTAVFTGQSFEKGLFFGNEFELRQPFDPKKLHFTYSNVDGWLIMGGVSYDGEDIENYDYSTDGKSSEFTLRLVVEDGELEDLEEYNDYVSFWPEDYEKTKDFKIKPNVKKKQTPELPGWYYCSWSSGYGTSAGQLEWTGEVWQEYEYNKPQTVEGVTVWSGINWDTSDMKNRPKRKPRTPKTDVYPYPTQEVLKAGENA